MRIEFSVPGLENHVSGNTNEPPLKTQTASESTDEALRRRVAELERALAVAENARRSLRNSEARLAGIIDIAQEAIITVDADFNIELFNQGAEKIFGYGREEVVGRSLNILIPESFRKDHHRHMSGFSSSADISRVMESRREIVGMRKDGTEFPAEASISKFEFGDHPIMTALLRDISTRKSAEQELKQSEASLVNAQRIGRMGNWDWDIVNNGLYWSDEIYNIFGMERDKFEATYEAFLATVHPDDRQLVEESVNAALADSIPYSVEHRIITPGGIEKFVHEQAEIRRDGDGAPIFMTGTVQDISERKRAEDALRRVRDEAALANRVKTEFLANMSHELRTPLNAIIGFSQLMESETLGPLENEAYKSYSADIHRMGGSLLEIVSDILEVSKIDQGEVDLEEENVDLEKEINSCISTVMERSDAAGLTVDFTISAGMPKLHGDRIRLKQAFLHLFGNAVKFNCLGGQINTSIDVSNAGEIVISIADTGIGIPADDIPKVLAPFGQQETAFLRTRGGVGLGLTLAQSFVDLHGGTIDLESAPGIGTTVIITFPRKRSVPN